VGGTSAVLVGWRATTIDVDLVFRPESDAMLRAIPMLKERLQLNVELASPDLFIPVPQGWEQRSPVITRIGRARLRSSRLPLTRMRAPSAGASPLRPRSHSARVRTPRAPEVIHGNYASR